MAFVKTYEELPSRTEVLRLGIVGVGLMGGMVGKIASSLNGVQIAAVSDINHELAVSMASRLRCKAYESGEELAELDGVHAVIITTPEDQHATDAIAALSHGKHVFVEKPLASSVADAEKIWQAGLEAGRLVVVGHVLRLDPAYGRARESVRAGDIGSLVHLWARRNTSIMDADRLHGRTSIIDYLGIHDIDALQWVSGSRIMSVIAQSARGRMTKYGVDDVVQALLRFEHGATGTLECSWIRPAEASASWGSGMGIWGTNGAIEISPYVSGVTVAAGGSSVGLNQAYLTTEGAFGEIAGIYRDELMSFIRCIQGDGVPFCSAEEGLAAVRVADALKRSLESGAAAEVRW